MHLQVQMAVYYTSRTPHQRPDEYDQIGPFPACFAGTYWMGQQLLGTTKKKYMSTSSRYMTGLENAAHRVSLSSQSDHVVTSALHPHRSFHVVPCSQCLFHVRQGIRSFRLLFRRRLTLRSRNALPAHVYDGDVRLGRRPPQGWSFQTSRDELRVLTISAFGSKSVYVLAYSFQLWEFVRATPAASLIPRLRQTCPSDC